MRTLLLALALLAGTAAADPVKPAVMSGCKKKVVGKGLERKVTCEIDTPIVVGQSAPKPSVAIVHADEGKKATGRPKPGDPFAGLSRQLH